MKEREGRLFTKDDPLAHCSSNCTASVTLLLYSLAHACRFSRPDRNLFGLRTCGFGKTQREDALLAGRLNLLSVYAGRERHRAAHLTYRAFAAHISAFLALALLFPGGMDCQGVALCRDLDFFWFETCDGRFDDVLLLIH